MSSRFADAEAAQRAVYLALPMLSASLADRDVGESRCMHIVVMDPCRPFGSCTFEEAILYEHSLPSRDSWDADYAFYAREKARVAWRTQTDSGVVATLSPHRLVVGDIALPGGIVYDGIVVAVSGANGWYDEAFARCVAALLRAAATARMEASRKA
ncbi:hypothetical protein AWV80_09415 [Cupriavidus sp. UYMU48A]|nr:hypothetical protein AWV80_09415 [Cupriavidus sp. UYMU48A]